jgi:hypothetical protein
MFYLDTDPNCEAPIAYVCAAAMNTVLELGGCVFGDTNWAEASGASISFDGGLSWAWALDVDPYFVIFSVATDYRYESKFWTQTVNTTE